MEKRKVTKLEKPIRAFEREEGWATVESPEEAVAIFHAMDHPVRRTVLDLLDEGPIRQVDLAKLLAASTGKDQDVAALLHHLEILEKAGLVGHEDISGGKTKVKIIYKTTDVRLQTYKRPKVELSREGGG